MTTLQEHEVRSIAGAIARKWRLTAEDAEDATQETVIWVWRVSQASPEILDRERLRWTVIHRSMVCWLRSNVNRLRMERCTDPEEFLDLGSGDETDLAESLELARILDLLPERHRRYLEARAEGHSHPGAQKQSGISRMAVQHQVAALGLEERL